MGHGEVRRVASNTASAATVRLLDIGDQQRQKRIDVRRARPIIRLWDGQMALRYRIDPVVISADYGWRLNDTGQATIVLPLDCPASQWLLNPWGRLRDKNTVVTMDKDGARWSGLVSKVRINKTNDGQHTVTLEALHDYEQLKRIYMWPNPFFPAAVQIPRSAIFTGPSIWVLKLALMLNLMRINAALWNLPDDPLDYKSWQQTWDFRQWSVVVKPDSWESLLQAGNTPWTLATSRMKSWHDMSEKILADAQLMVECRRWLTGDPEPWEGANLRHGTLVVDIVDKSGWWSKRGTGTFGTLWTGLVRTVQSATGTDVEVNQTIVDEPVDVADYRKPDWFGTHPSVPYVVYRDGPLTGVQSSEFSWEPATTVSVISGGQSAPGVNAAMSAALQVAGNALGTFLAAPSAGSIASTLLEPLFTDTLLAWAHWKSLTRAQQLGIHRYQEFFAEGADKAWTLSSVVAMRKAYWETRERLAHKLDIADGAPWFIGDRGHGHFFLGDRIASTVEGLPAGKLVVEQVTELKFSMSRDGFGWEATVGDYRSTESSLEHILRTANSLTSTVQELAVRS